MRNQSCIWSLLTYVFIVLVTLIFAVGCAESENPIEPIEGNEDIGGQYNAPEGELPTIVIEVANIRGTKPGILNKMFVIIDDRLTEIDVVFQERIYYLIGIRTIDNVWLENPSRVKINVLDNHIVDPEPHFEEIAGVLVNVNRPIQINDKLEVVVRHRFKYKRDDDGRENNFHEMIFVDVVRNLTRPDIKF